MEPAVLLDQEPDRRWELARQMGVTGAVTGLPRTDGADPWSFDPLLAMRNRFDDRGFSLEVVESRPPMADVVLGREGREEGIAAVQELLRNMGRLDIPVYCWVWTENPVGVRRNAEVPDRGGAVQTAYDHAFEERAPAHPVDITEAQLWENLQYFLDQVVPVAEEAGVKLALHPDDPPISPVRGVPRLVTSVENYERILGMYDSDHHGVCLCQGNFALMEEPVPEAIRRLGDSIEFVHFRDVEGTPERFVETWHDDGPTDMAACVDAYREVGFEGPARPDHVPAMAGDDRGDYGRLFAVGYMRGLLE